MENFIEVNNNWMLSEDHLVLTNRGWLKAKDLQTGDKVVGLKGKSKIKSIIKCGNRPDAPIIGKTE